MKYVTTLGAAFILIGVSGLARAEYDLGCKVDEIKTLINWCIDPAQKDLSKLQQDGRDNILKGHFCGKPLFVTDGVMSCWLHDVDQVKIILACKPEAHAAAAQQAIPNSETRKPADCSGRI
ncbi:MAG: hypothetical protein ABIW48_04880 [Burkholderiales bacterium]